MFGLKLRLKFSRASPPLRFTFLKGLLIYVNFTNFGTTYDKFAHFVRLRRYPSQCIGKHSNNSCLRLPVFLEICRFYVTTYTLFPFL